MKVPSPDQVILGLDLAWGERARTGVCVAIGDHVVDSAVVRTDDEVLSWISRYRTDDLIVAVDAPLVVTNESGARDCERLITTLYGAAGAGTYPSSLGRPDFLDGGRARRLSRAAGLSVDPGEPAARMVEVYPHTAIVSLFGLDRRLAYKAKRGRSVEDRKGAFLQLLAHLQSLRTFDPPFDVTTGARWAHLRSEVETATRQVDLEQVEDELDAHMCAYVARYHARWADVRSVVIGDVDHGYIVTPIDAPRLERLRAGADTRRPRRFLGASPKPVASAVVATPEAGHASLLELEDIARAIQVRDLQVPLGRAVTFEPEMAASIAHGRLHDLGYDHAPVAKDGRLVGFVARAGLASAGDGTVADATHPVDSSVLVSADSPISRLLAWLNDQPFLFVLDGHDVTGFVTPSDLNRQASRTYFYLLIAGFETTLAELIRQRCGDDESLFTALTAKRAADVRTRWDSARVADVDAGPIAHMDFSDLLTIGALRAEVRTGFGFSSRNQWDSATGSLVSLRHAVMHPSRGDLIGRERDLAKVADLERRLRQLNDRGAALTHHHGHPSDSLS